MEELLFEYLSKYISLTTEEKQAIVDLNIFYSFKKGTVLLDEGQISNKCYFVLKGCLRKYYLKDGDEKTTDFFTDFDAITPTTAINNLPSEYYIICNEDSFILISTAEMGEEINAKFPKFEKLCNIMSEIQINKIQLSYDEFKTSTPEQRYLNLLHNKPDLIQRAPQVQIASYLGITPQSLSRLRTRILVNSN